MTLTNLFNPKSIALIGASNTPDKLGNYLASNLIKSGYVGNLYFLNPKKELICGKDSLQKPEQIKHHIDLWVIAIPAQFVIDTVLDIIAQMKNNPSDNPTFVCIISSGFKETGIDGLALETELVLLTRQHNFNIIGPNCLGLINNEPDSKYRFNASFANPPKLSGGISFVSQSGAIISGIVDKLENQGIGFNKIISLGNQLDLEAQDFLEFLITDPQTKVIGLYLEGFENGSKFVQIASKSTKPIIILKAGNSKISQKAISSHTGSIAGNYETAKTYLEEAGCVWAENLEDFENYLKFFSRWN